MTITYDIMISPIPCSNEKCTLEGLPASRIIAHVLHLKLPQLARIHSWHSSPAEGSPVFTGSTLVRSPFTWTTSTLIAIPWSTEPPSAGYRYSGIVITISLAWSVCASVQSQVYDIDSKEDSIDSAQFHFISQRVERSFRVTWQVKQN